MDALYAMNYTDELEDEGEIALAAYDRYIGLEPSEVAVDCCVTKAPLRRREGRQEPG